MASFDANYLSYKIIFGIFITIFLSIAGYFASSTLTKLSEIQKDIVGLQIQVSDMNARSDKNFILLKSEIICKDDIVEMINYELNKHIVNYHSK